MSNFWTSIDGIYIWFERKKSPKLRISHPICMFAFLFCYFPRVKGSSLQLTAMRWRFSTDSGVSVSTKYNYKGKIYSAKVTSLVYARPLP